MTETASVDVQPRELKTDVIPLKLQFFKIDQNDNQILIEGFPHGHLDEVDLKALCVFSATGFFLDQDTYFKKSKALSPGCIYQMNNDQIVDQKRYYQWDKEKVSQSLEESVDQFQECFESIVEDQSAGQNIVLPLSGGLDSRTMAVALSGKKVSAFSYQFENGLDENQYGRDISKVCGFDYNSFIIPKGYIWNCLDELAEINGCYTDMVQPRQMAVLQQLSLLGNHMALGHWGDVLFDDVGYVEGQDLVDFVLKKVLKRGGLDFASLLWSRFGLDGNFETYLKERVSDLLARIEIADPTAKIRAFKSLYWAPRWTTVSLAIFEKNHSISLPYYHEKLCRLISRIPEEHLKGRRIQIEYIKRKSPECARIPWQLFHPLDLYHYENYFNASRIPSRFVRKVMRKLKYRKDPLVIRNWEIQFLGEKNLEHLNQHLLENPNLKALIPEEVLKSKMDLFKQEPLAQSHAIGILLSLSAFSRKFLS